MDAFLFHGSIGVVIAFLAYNLWSLLRYQIVITDNSWKVFACDECFSYWTSIFLTLGLYLIFGYVETVMSLAVAMISIKLLSKDYWS